MELTVLQSIFLGLIEGLTEFIPVSSTAHLILGRHILGIPQTTLTDLFIVAVQSGAILAALWYFWKAFSKQPGVMLKVAVAFIPTAVVGLLLQDTLPVLFGNSNLIGIALILGGVLFLFLKEKNIVQKTTLTWKDALLLGVFQIAAFVPGVSRSGALLIGGMLVGLPKRHIAIFSFLLALPTILGATTVQLWSGRALLTPSLVTFISIGAVVAFGTALFSMALFLRFIEKKHSLKWLGVYRIIIGLLFLMII